MSRLESTLSNLRIIAPRFILSYYLLSCLSSTVLIEGGGGGDRKKIHIDFSGISIDMKLFCYLLILSAIALDHDALLLSSSTPSRFLRFWSIHNFAWFISSLRAAMTASGSSSCEKNKSKWCAPLDITTT